MESRHRSPGYEPGLNIILPAMKFGAAPGIRTLFSHLQNGGLRYARGIESGGRDGCCARFISSVTGRRPCCWTSGPWCVEAEFAPPQKSGVLQTLGLTRAQSTR